MKKKLISLLAFSSLLLVACGNDSDAATVEDNDTEDIVEEVESEEIENEEIEEETLEIDSEQSLENIGEFKYTRDGRVELLNIVRPTETYKLIEDVDIDFKDIKILYHSEIPESEKEFFKEFYGFDEKGHSIQFSYSVTNTTDETIGGIEIIDIVTSNGNQYNLYNHGGTIQGSAYEVRPNATANVGLIFTVTEPNIEGLDLYFQPLDKDGYHLDEKQIQLSF